MFVNLGSYLAISIITSPRQEEIEQVRKFVDVYTPVPVGKERTRITKAPTVIEFVDLMAKFIGEKQAHSAISEYLGNREIDEKGSVKWTTPFGSTRKAGPPEIMEQEDLFLKALRKTDSISMERIYLYMQSSDGQTELIFYVPVK